MGELNKELQLIQIDPSMSRMSFGNPSNKGTVIFLGKMATLGSSKGKKVWAHVQRDEPVTVQSLT